MLRGSSISVRSVRGALNNGSPFSLQFNRGMAGRILYTAESTAVGGRNGTAKSTDGTDALDLKLSMPKALGGPGGEGTNPEQLFSAGYAACFLGAMGAAAKKLKKSLPESTAVRGTVHFISDNGKLGLGVGLHAHSPDISTADLQKIMEEAHQICPYSNATRGNINVDLSAEGA
ncbi:hypothetical protein KFL_000910010 [Klebsormidium nitens]|uniref:Organic hydroperoxide resistance protein n=1 Tax=Klebsormidium nitens TaxID=105231 RepID=A0A1Y1HT34_KLENI|nr:hypothetical protein KFL_000910010 [Klebsormidium nitens]|eukprot:GAQ81780.1 hypothetical protein KFL_000910010 [Klebsormidium nitens]